MYNLYDTFNGRKISSHRTVKNAVRAKLAHIKAVEKANGSGSYVTYAISDNNDKVVDIYYLGRAECEIEHE